MKKSYKLIKNTKKEQNPTSPKSVTNLSKKLRVFMLLGWSVIAVGIYIALNKVSFVYSLWVFAIMLMAAFIGYFAVGVGVGRYVRMGKGDSTECARLVDTGKIILIFIIPVVFIIIYDFFVSTYKMFM